MEDVISKVKDILDKAIKDINKTLSLVGIENVGIITNPSADYIIDGVCEFYNIDRESLKKRCRDKDLVTRRKITVHLLKAYTKSTLSQISSYLGYKKHETALYHFRDASSMLSGELYGCEEFKKTYKEIVKHLKLQEK